MTAREKFEEEALTAVRDEVAAALPEVRSRRLELGSLEISRHRGW
jgi:hypothetical protein